MDLQLTSPIWTKFIVMWNRCVLSNTDPFSLNFSPIIGFIVVPRGEDIIPRGHCEPGFLLQPRCYISLSSRPTHATEPPITWQFFHFVGKFDLPIYFFLQGNCDSGEAAGDLSFSHRRPLCIHFIFSIFVRGIVIYHICSLSRTGVFSRIQTPSLLTFHPTPISGFIVVPRGEDFIPRRHCEP